MNISESSCFWTRSWELAPPPASRLSGDRVIGPGLAGIFRIRFFQDQANMNPKHRDRVSFIRVVSGCFAATWWRTTCGSGKPVRLRELAAAVRAGSRDRGRAGRATWSYRRQLRFPDRDTVSEDPAISYHEIRGFAPECFAYIRNSSHGQIQAVPRGARPVVKEASRRRSSFPIRSSVSPCRRGGPAAI